MSYDNASRAQDAQAINAALPQAQNEQRATDWRNPYPQPIKLQGFVLTASQQREIEELKLKKPRYRVDNVSTTTED